MTTTLMPSHGLLPKLQQELRTRRAARTRRRQLERELDSYRTPAEINDLLILIGRQDTPGADEVRAVLNDNLASYGRRAA